MAKQTRNLDNQGRLVLPSHIRKALNLAPGNAVTVDLDDDGTILVRATNFRCHICGDSVKPDDCLDVPSKSGNKLICPKCAEAIVDFYYEKKSEV